MSPFGREHMFLSFNADRDKQTETEGRSREKVGDEGRKQVILGDHSAVTLAFKAWLSPYWANTVCVELIWAVFVEGRLGKTRWNLLFMWSDLKSTGCNLWKITSQFSHCIHLNPSPWASKHECKRAKQHLKWLCSGDKILSGNKKTHIHKQN